MLILDSINVRSAANASSKKVGSAKLGQLFKYLGVQKDSTGTDWYKIQYTSAKVGWVTSQYAHVRSAANSKLGVNTNTNRYLKRTLTVTAKSAAVYSAIGTSSKKMGTVAKGKKYTALSWGTDKYSTTWYSIRSGGKVVWISSKNVSISDTFTTIPERKFESGSTPIIYLSPSNQVNNKFCVGNTTEQKQMYRVAEALKVILEKLPGCTVLLNSRS